MIDLTPVFNAAIALVAVLLTTFLVPWIKTKLSKEQTDSLLMWAEIAAAAAQQLYWDLDGETRKQHALELLAEKGFDINTAEVQNALEAAVLKLHSALEARGQLNTPQDSGAAEGPTEGSTEATEEAASHE